MSFFLNATIGSAAFQASISSGVRYVEDEPYALYESAIEYQGVYADEQAMKKDLTATVEEYYENYVSTQNSSQSLAKEVAKSQI